MPGDLHLSAFGHKLWISMTSWNTPKEASLGHLSFSLTMALYMVSAKSERGLKITYPAERPNGVQLGDLKMLDLNTKTPDG